MPTSSGSHLALGWAGVQSPSYLGCRVMVDTPQGSAAAPTDFGWERPGQQAHRVRLCREVTGFLEQGETGLKDGSALPGTWTPVSTGQSSEGRGTESEEEMTKVLGLKQRTTQ